MEEKNLQLERLVFFSDAVVAIAITLLALDLKLGHLAGEHLQFSDITAQWKTFAAFFLSFINIASFWKRHHSFFAVIYKIDERLLWLNIMWLFFIVTLPFSTSLVGEHFSDTPAIFTYCLNMFLVSCFQNLIWDYSSYKMRFIHEEKTDKEYISRMRVYCNLEMINGIVSMGLSFYNPKIAFICLYTRLPMIILARLYYSRKGEVPRPPRRRQSS